MLLSPPSFGNFYSMLSVWKVRGFEALIFSKQGIIVMISAYDHTVVTRLDLFLLDGWKGETYTKKTLWRLLDEPIEHCSLLVEAVGNSWRRPIGGELTIDAQHQPKVSLNASAALNSSSCSFFFFVFFLGEMWGAQLHCELSCTKTIRPLQVLTFFFLSEQQMTGWEDLSVSRFQDSRLPPPPTPLPNTHSHTHTCVTSVSPDWHERNCEM